MFNKSPERPAGYATDTWSSMSIVFPVDRTAKEEITVRFIPQSISNGKYEVSANYDPKIEGLIQSSENQRWEQLFDSTSADDAEVLLKNILTTTPEL